jgi:hypothetical protein
MPMGDDEPRPDGLSRADHLRDNVYWMQRARDDGIPILGYLYWSLTDNYEWGSYAPRFGLYRVDAVADPALRRQPTDAVHAYRCIVSVGGVPPDYRPVRKQEDGSPSGATNPDQCPATPARAAPQLTKLRLLDSRVRTGLPLRIRFHLDDAGRVRLLVRATRSGRVLAIRTVRAKAGTTRLTWYVRLLRAGRYTLTLTPAGGRGRTVAFRVVGSTRRAPSRRVGACCRAG